MNGMYKNNSTGYRGVTWREDLGKYHAKIGFCGARLHLGYYEDPKDAARAYNKKAKEIFGKGCFQNKIKGKK